MGAQMELPDDLIERIGQLLTLVVQDGEFLDQETWYTQDEEIAERKRRTKELAEEARPILAEMDAALLGEG